MFFAIAHRSYGLLAMADTFFVGLGLQYLFIFPGPYVSIAIHFLHNFLNGIVYGIIKKKELEITGYQAAKETESAVVH